MTTARVSFEVLDDVGVIALVNPLRFRPLPARTRNTAANRLAHWQSLLEARQLVLFGTGIGEDPDLAYDDFLNVSVSLGRTDAIGTREFTTLMDAGGGALSVCSIYDILLATDPLKEAELTEIQKSISSMLHPAKVQRDVTRPTFHNIFPVPPGPIQVRVVQLFTPGEWSLGGRREHDFRIELMSARDETQSLTTFPWLGKQALIAL